MSLLTNLVAHWKLNEASGTRFDSHGSNDLTDNNTVTSSTGKLGDAASFASASFEYLSRSDNADLSLGTDQAFSIAGWYKAAADPGFTGRPLIVKRGGSLNSSEYALWFPNTGYNFEFQVGNGSSNASVQSVAGVGTTAWVFFVAWHDPVSDTLNLQINNGTVQSIAWSSGTQNTSSNFAIGRDLGGWTGAYWNGLIDSVSFWKRTLTSDERTELYNSGNGLDYEDFEEDTGVEGSLDVTEVDDTIVSSGDVLVTGALSVTEANDTASSGGDVLVVGVISIAEADDTLSASGDILVEGVLDFTESNDTISAAGDVLVTGELDVLEDDDTLFARDGALELFGVADITEANDTVDAGGWIKIRTTIYPRSAQVVFTKQRTKATTVSNLNKTKVSPTVAYRNVGRVKALEI